MDPSTKEIQIRVEDGIFYTNIPAFSNHLLKDCFRSFLNQKETYRKNHLQKSYGYAFDGYSYYGQKDSSNQAYDDLLETFVFSNFFPKEKFPKEFIPFFEQEWKNLLECIKKTEQTILSTLSLSKIADIHKEIGHMVSCNYYPAQNNFDGTAAENTRLSAHPDVSLITIFPFGVDGDLEYQMADGTWKTMTPTDRIIGFSGYLMELATDGKIKALNHRVRLSKNRNSERFSFAFFSLPFPAAQLPTLDEETISGKEYFEKYLALF